MLHSKEDNIVQAYKVKSKLDLGERGLIVSR
jgi:hypothetical protein